MSEPRGQVIRRMARDVGMENPVRATYAALIAHINARAEEKERQTLHARLEAELDGARPFF